jgi:glucokinase
VEHPAERPVLAVDLGGTQIRAALITPDRQVLHRRAIETRDEDGVTAVLDRIVETAAAVRDDARRAGEPEPAGLGISAPGPLDRWHGVVLAAPNLHGWSNVSVVDHVAPRIGLDTFLERDTNVAVMAEWRYGAGRGARNVIYITVSTGIGGGIVLDGRPIIGPDGSAGEVGHMTVDLDGPVCGCGGIGHVEAIGSGTALAREARALLDAGRAPILARLARDGREPDAQLLAQAADAGDAEATRVLERAWEAIGALCASLVNVLDPEVIVLGGSIAQHQPRLFEVIDAEIERRAFAFLRHRVRIERAALGGDVSLVGLLPIVNDRMDDAALEAAASRPPSAAQQQGASPS